MDGSGNVYVTLFKVMQSNGGWGFYFDLLGADYRPMPNLIYAPNKN